MHPFYVQRVQALQLDDYAIRSGTLEYVLQIPFSLLKCCFPMRHHPSQGKEFSTRIIPMCGRRRTHMQYDAV